jgi:hypothetical protein
VSSHVEFPGGFPQGLGAVEMAAPFSSQACVFSWRSEKSRGRLVSTARDADLRNLTDPDIFRLPTSKTSIRAMYTQHLRQAESVLMQTCVGRRDYLIFKWVLPTPGLEDGVLSVGTKVPRVYFSWLFLCLSTFSIWKFLIILHAL